MNGFVTLYHFNEEKLYMERKDSSRYTVTATTYHKFCNDIP